MGMNIIESDSSFMPVSVVCIPSVLSALRRGQY